MLVSSYLLNANWYVILMRCNNNNKRTLDAGRQGNVGVFTTTKNCMGFRVSASHPADVLVLVPSVFVMQSVCGYRPPPIIPRRLPGDSAKRLFS